MIYVNDKVTKEDYLHAIPFFWKLHSIVVLSQVKNICHNCT